MELQVKLLNEDAQLPKYGSSYAAGMDLYSSIDVSIPSHSTKIVNTGISIQWKGENDSEYYFRIAPRSGLSVKGIFVNAGVVDFDYRGEIKVVLFNSTNEDFQIVKGDRIAQGILERINRPNIIKIDELNETERGISGFGSTGLR